MNKRTFFCWLTVAAVLLMGYFKLNFYPQLSQGDHGRDLYSAQAVLRGELPYKDFWWVYGPMMPYYFAVFYKIAGSTIVGFLLGDLVLKAAAAAFFYLACSCFIAPLLAFLGAVWFAQSQPDFFFTFNHAGGITAELWIIFMLFAFIKNKAPKYLWMSLPAVLIYCLIKINFGLAAFVVVLVTAGFHKFKEKKFYLTSVTVLCLTAFIYWLLLKDLSIEEIRQCMPYFGDDQPHHFPPSMTIPYYFTQHWLTLVHAWLDLNQILTRNWMSSGFTVFLFCYNLLNCLHHVILHLATILVIWQIATGKIKDEERKGLLWILSILGIFFILNFHEFVVSGVWYRTYWSLPFLFMFHALMIAIGYRLFPKLIRGLIWSLLGALLILNGMVSFFTTQQQKMPPNFLNSPYAQVYLGNEPQWTQTVNAVSAFLKQNLKANETFFALPYDDIYYYLTDKQSPSRMLIFFDHIKITPKQEVDIIKELETKNVAYVLMSNRIASSERGLGIFGKTYCPLIAAYINQKYAPLARQGGDWQKEPGWGNNHGVLILKRR